VSGFADLIVVSRELRALMLTAGLMRADGEDIHPAVKAFREYKHTELSYLKQMVELRTAQALEPLDVVAQMARVEDPPAEDPPDQEEPLDDPPTKEPPDFLIKTTVTLVDR
jgi:hypothetical protein